MCSDSEQKNPAVNQTNFEELLKICETLKSENDSLRKQLLLANVRSSKKPKEETSTNQAYKKIYQDLKEEYI